MQIQVFCAALVVALLAGCGGRPTAPVQTERTTDAELTCAHILAESEVNLARIEGLVGEGELATGQNVAFLLIAPIVALPMFLDLGTAEQDEIKALEARNVRLAELGEQKGCDLSG
ncbi:MAG: hypothetical protein AAF674_13845 [Pseudomonadota bacterium]